MTPRFVAVLGATATGKSSLGLAIAHRCGGEIVNCDSTAVYRGFDIGTDKLPLRQRREELLRLQWVKDATVTRIWPNRLRIQVVEREPVA